MHSKWITAMLLIPLLGFTGCQQDQTTGSPSSDTPNVDSSKFLLSSQPEGAKDVIAVREAASDGDDVLVVGRIGGSENPWVEGRAAFAIVDNSLKACSDIPGDMCEQPWDYCCETEKLPASTALIKVVGEDGGLVRTDARKLLNVKELSTVAVKGKAQRDDTGNLTVLATGVYVVKQ